jgi:transcriptional regulator with XRE-family HTH domain
MTVKLTTARARSSPKKGEKITPPSANPVDDDHEDAFHFGTRLRAFRKARGWSLERAAEAVGVPGSTLSRIENRKMSPTLDLIQKIVRAMDLHPYDILGRDKAKANAGSVSVTRKGHEEYTELPNILYAPLHPDSEASGIRPIFVTLFARSVQEYGGLTAHAGDEFLYVLAGSVELHLENREVERLNAGDSILFDSHIPHAYVSAGDAQAKLLIVASTMDAAFHSLPV